MDFFMILTTPAIIKTVCITIVSQCSIVIFANIAKNLLAFSFLTIILVLNKENPSFMDFFDPYISSDLHCKFFHGKLCKFFLRNFSHYSSTLIFIEIDYKSNYSKIYMNYQWIPWNVLISSIRNIIFIW